MLSHFDHRFSTYLGATQKQLNKGTLPRLTEKEHDDPDVETLARYWVQRQEIAAKLGDRWDRDWLFGWRLIARAVDLRTFSPSVLPRTGIGNSFALVFPQKPEMGFLLQAAWSSLTFDYLSRQKLSGANLVFTLVKQLACPTPNSFESPAQWLQDVKLVDWVLPYVVELSYTSWRLRPYAENLGDSGPPFHWDGGRRARLRADLDAGFLHIYGLDRSEAEHVLDSFFVLRKYDVRDYGEYRTKRLVLEAYDGMAKAIANGGKGWEPLADPPAGQGPRHNKAR
jgi:hypothetical protein